MKRKELRKQLRKESIATIVLYLIYFSWWYLTAYGLGDKDLGEYTYLFGLPMWFIVSCIGGFLLITTLVYFCVTYIFKEVDFEVEDDE